MLESIGRSLALGCPGALLSLSTVGSAAHPAGYTVGTRVVWDEQDGQSAAAYGAAHAQQVGSNNATVQYRDDVGPQLLSRFGASAWRGNVAGVQCSPEIFVDLVPGEVDWYGVAPLAPDLSRPFYRVDPAIIGPLDTLP
jgi:hypothetical protein